MGNSDHTPAEFFKGIDEALKSVPKDGTDGEFPCPICKTGLVHWIRVPRNKHIRLGCTTPSCILLLQ